MGQPAIAGKAAIGRGVSASLERTVRVSAYVVLLTVSYYLAARVGLGFRFQNSQIGVVWPAGAVLLSALLLAPRSRWWLVLASTAVAHIALMANVVPPWRWSWQIVSNALFIVVTAETLRRAAGLPLRFDSRRQVLAYTGTVFAMPALFCLISPAFIRSVLHLESLYTPGEALLRTTLSNATAMLLVGPVVLLWADYGLRGIREVSARRLVEGAVIMILLVAVGLIAFGTGPEIARLPTLLLWIFPPLLWAAVRLGPIGAATSLLSVAALSMWGTAHQLGPFVLVTDADQVVTLQLFWIVICPPIMLLAAAIREREQAEDALHEQRDELAHVTRIATVGELSGALSHELRQPLMSILANAQAGLRLLENDHSDITELRAILEDITQRDKQAASVIAHLRSFIKGGESHFETLAIDSIVRDALALSRSAGEFSGVQIQTQIASELPGVTGDPVQLLQVLVNLIINGCESMIEMPEPERRLRLQVARLDDERVEVVVADSGVGLPDGREDRVFEPFFTTKERGLGLGLAIGRSIVATHGGRLWGENNPNRGATFHLVLRTNSAHGEHAEADRNR